MTRPIAREAWARITDLFGRALDCPATERAAFIAQLREEDPAAAMELESLLTAHDREGEFLPDLPTISPPLPDLAGRTVGPYRLVRQIGRGGMGVVYLAERADGAFTQRVAVKLLHGFLDDDRVLRFRAERQILASLDHPNIARLLDGGTTPDGSPYLVMDYVDGVPIDRYCSERQLSMADRLRLFAVVSAAVGHAHRHLIVHRDSSPSNIIVSANGCPNCSTSASRSCSIRLEA